MMITTPSYWIGRSPRLTGGRYSATNRRLASGSGRLGPKYTMGRAAIATTPPQGHGLREGRMGGAPVALGRAAVRASPRTASGRSQTLSGGACVGEIRGRDLRQCGR